MATELKRKREIAKRWSFSESENQLRNYTTHWAGEDPIYILKCRITLEEELSRPDYARLSVKNVETRKFFVERVNDMGETLKLHKATTHVAITLLDRVLCSGIKVGADTMPLVCLICTQLACKLEMAHHAAPDVETLLETLGQFFSGYCDDIMRKDIKIIERDLLDLLDFRVMTITAAHFLDSLRAMDLLFSEEHGDTVPLWMTMTSTSKVQKKDARTLHETLNTWTSYFIELAMLNAPNFSTLPKIDIALIVLACARQATGIYPVLPSYLESILQKNFSPALSEHQARLFELYQQEVINTESESENDPNATQQLLQTTAQAPKASKAVKSSPDGVDDVEMRKRARPQDPA